MTRLAAGSLVLAALALACDPPLVAPADAGSDAPATPDTGPAAPDCTGIFGLGTVIVPGVLAASSPAVTADELEIFLGDGPHFAVVRRSAVPAPFTARTALPELDAACASAGLANPQIDVSADGLRVYFTCSSAASPVFVAHRADRRSAFVVDGTVADGVELLAVVDDERAIYGASGGAPFRAIRAAIGEPFPTLHIVAELATIQLTAPDLSPDGLTLYGSFAGHVVSYARPSASGTFGTTPTTLDLATAGEMVGSPEIAPSCRTLYFLLRDTVGVRVYAAPR